MVDQGRAGALIVWADGGEQEISTPGGRLRSSYRGELMAIQQALGHLRDNQTNTNPSIVICTDFQAPYAPLETGPPNNAHSRTSLYGTRSKAWQSLSTSLHALCPLQKRGAGYAEPQSASVSSAQAPLVPNDQKYIYTTQERWRRGRPATSRQWGRGCKTTEASRCCWHRWKEQQQQQQQQQEQQQQQQQQRNCGRSQKNPFRIAACKRGKKYGNVPYVNIQEDCSN